MFATLLTRPRLLTATSFAAVCAVLACHPTLARSLGADVWNVPNLNAQFQAASDESVRLSAEDDTVLNRIALKEAVVQELLEGRATLAEATDRFTRMNAARPQTMEAVRLSYPGDTDREKTARNVISFALSRIPAAEQEDLSQRLEAQLRELSAASSAH